MYGVFLYMLCGFFDMMQLLLVCYVIFVYCCMLVEYVVIDKEVVQYIDYYSDQCNFQKDVYFVVKLFDGDFMW